MTDADSKKRLKDTKFVIDASHNEMFMLWEKFSDEAMRKNPDFNKFKFEQMNAPSVGSFTRQDNARIKAVEVLALP